MSCVDLLVAALHRQRRRAPTSTRWSRPNRSGVRPRPGRRRRRRPPVQDRIARYVLRSPSSWRLPLPARTLLKPTRQERGVSAAVCRLLAHWPNARSRFERLPRGRGGGRPRVDLRPSPAYCCRGGEGAASCLTQRALPERAPLARPSLARVKPESQRMAAQALRTVRRAPRRTRFGAPSWTLPSLARTLDFLPPHSHSHTHNNTIFVPTPLPLRLIPRPKFLRRSSAAVPPSPAPP